MKKIINIDTDYETKKKARMPKINFMRRVFCRSLHKKYHATKFLCDGVAFGFEAGRCLKCGHRWNYAHLSDEA